MKKGWCFLISFLVVVFLFMSFQVVAQVFAPGADVDIPVKSKIFGFLKDINVLNIAFIAFATFAGGLWAMSRSKLKMMGELFMKAYEYTDDKHLSAAERQDLIMRFLSIIGKTSTPSDSDKFVKDNKRGSGSKALYR